jgi:hypothetical protein
MKHFDRVEIPVNSQIPAFRSETRRYLGKVIGFYEQSVFILLDEPVMVNNHPEPVVRVSASLPLPMGWRFVEGRGWVEIDLRYLCTTSACMKKPTSLVSFNGPEKVDRSALYCDDCTTIMRQSAFFVSATPLARIEEIASDVSKDRSQ